MQQEGLRSQNLISPRSQQSVGGRPISRPTSPNRMVSNDGGVQRTKTTHKPGDRSLRPPRQCETTNLWVPISSPSGCSKRRASPRLEQMEDDLPLPTSQHSSRSMATSPRIHGQRGDNTTSSPIRLVDEPPSTDENQREPESNPNSREPTSVQRSRLALDLSRILFLKTILTEKWGAGTAEELLKSERTSTRYQYQHCWKAFQKWLRASSVTTINTRVTLDFLRYVVEDLRLAPRTALVYRSALRFPLEQAFNIETGDKEFHMLAKAQFHCNPRPKRIIPQWSLNKVLDLLSTPKYNNNEISTNDLLQKTIFLTALATANRVSEIAAINRHAIIFHNNNMKVTLPVKPNFHYKNQTMLRSPPNIVIPGIPTNTPNNHLCPVKTIDTWLIHTADYGGDSLFFNASSSKRLTAQAISRHLCRLIIEAHPGTRPRGHDVRKVSTSLAWARGCNMTDIIERAFWSSSNVFITRYLSHLPRDTGQCVALGSLA